MIRLDTTTRKLQALLGGAITTTNPDVVVSYSDKTSLVYTGATTVIAMNGVTAVDICAAPAASTVRDVDIITIRNNDTVSAAVTVRYNDNATLYKLVTATLLTGETLSYTHAGSWLCLDVNGNIKTIAGSAVPVSATTGISGTLLVAHGGLGANTLTVHGVLIGNTANPVKVSTAGTLGQSFQSGGASADPAFAWPNVALSSLSDEPIVTPNFSTALDFSYSILGNRTLANPSNALPGHSGVIYITQANTGSHTLAYGSAWKFETNTAPTLSTTNGYVDALAYKVRTSTSITAKLIVNVG